MSKSSGASTDAAKRGRTYWMHTIGRQPAGFDGQQICYWWIRAPLATSLKQIRAERQKCIDYRYRKGYSVDPAEYGHITVRIP